MKNLREEILSVFLQADSHDKMCENYVDLFRTWALEILFVAPEGKQCIFGPEMKEMIEERIEEATK